MTVSKKNQQIRFIVVFLIHIFGQTVVEKFDIKVEPVLPRQ